MQDLKEVGLDCNRLEIEAECCTVSSCGKLQVGSHPQHGGVLQIVCRNNDLFVPSNHLKWFHFTTSTWGCAAMPLASTSTSNSSVCLSYIEALLVGPFARVVGITLQPHTHKNKIT